MKRQGQVQVGVRTEETARVLSPGRTAYGLVPWASAARLLTHSLFYLHGGGIVRRGTFHGHGEATSALGGGRHGDECDRIGQLVLDRLGGQPFEHGSQHHLIVALPTGERGTEGAEILPTNLEAPPASTVSHAQSHHYSLCYES